jgi:hypothetical protein
VKNSNALPWNLFVPDLITALTIAPEVRPNSASTDR